MSQFTRILAAGVMVTLTGALSFAQTTTPEVEPNGDKVEATTVTGMDAGDDIAGACTGSVNGAGNMAPDSADYWDISTAPQASSGWYRWTLTITSGNDMDIRALDTSGSAGSGSTAVAGSDDFAQGDSNDEVHWYSNESVSRIYVRVTGSGSSPMAYSGVLTNIPVMEIVVPGSFLPGMIQVTTVGQTTQDTDISIADSTRTIIPGFLNDDDGIGMPGLQSELTRAYAPGTYYLVISDYDQNNSEGAAIDDDYVNGEIMDFPNVYVGSSTSTGDDLTFLIDDGQGTMVVTPASKAFEHGMEIFKFTVGLGGSAGLCAGDGGDQMGCTNCPCGNNTAAGSVGGCLNSSGNGTRLIPSGSPSVSLPTGSTLDLRFGAEQLPAFAFCILTAGDALTPSNMANPCFGLDSGVTDVAFDGLRCVTASTQSHGGRRSDAQGEVGVTNNPWGGEGNPPAGIAQRFGYSAGQTRYFQIIHRDGALAVCLTGINTSQAVGVSFTP